MASDPAWYDPQTTHRIVTHCLTLSSTLTNTAFYVPRTLAGTVSQKISYLRSWWDHLCDFKNLLRFLISMDITMREDKAKLLYLTDHVTLTLVESTQRRILPCAGPPQLCANLVSFPFSAPAQGTSYLLLNVYELPITSSMLITSQRQSRGSFLVFYPWTSLNRYFRWNISISW